MINGLSERAKQIKKGSCFQMTAFGAEIVIVQFIQTFKTKGQIHHKAGSLLPLSDGQNKYLQMYLIGNGNDELEPAAEFRLA